MKKIYTRSKKPIIIILSLTLILYLVLLSAKAFLTKEKDNLVEGYQNLLGVSVSDATTSRNTFLINQINKNAVETQNFNFLVKEAQNDPGQQVENIRELISFGIDLLIVSPLKDNLVFQELSKIKDKLSIIILDEKEYSELGDAFIEYDNYNAGKLLAEEIKSNPKIKEGLLIITGPESDYVSNQRKKGLFENLSYDVQNKTTFLESNWIRNDAENRMKHYIVSNHISGSSGIVVGLNDQMAFGAYNGAKKLRVEGNDYYGINGFPSDQEGMELVDYKIFQGTIIFEDMYQKIVEVSEAILSGQDVETVNILKANFYSRSNNMKDVDYKRMSISVR